MKLKINHTTDHTSERLGALPAPPLPALTLSLSLYLTLMELSMMHCSHIFLSLSLFFSLFHILVVVINCFVAALIDAPAPNTPRRRQRTEKPIPATTFASVHLPVRLGHGTIIEICFLAITDQRARCVGFGVGFEFRVRAPLLLLLR